MDESGRMLSKILLAATIPLLLVVTVPLAILTALVLYLLAIANAFWLLCRAVPGWVRALKSTSPIRKPHFLEARTKPLSQEKPKRS